MNHRYEDPNHEREDRDRERGRYGRNATNPNEGGREFSPGSHGFEDHRERQQYSREPYGHSASERDRDSRSGAGRYGAARHGSYGGEGQYDDNDRGYSESSGGNYGQGRHSVFRWQESSQPGGQRYRQGGGGYGGYGGRGSYGGYGSTGDYGYGSQGRGGWGDDQGTRSNFGNFGSSYDENPQYYGTGNYSSGGSGYGGGYYGGGRWQGGLGAYGPSGASYGSQYGNQYRFGSGGEYGGGRQGWTDRDEQRPGLLKRIFGRGPKGYKRSDERLKEDISERLMQSDTIDSSEVTIEVADGRVTLQGTVPERYMKHAIEDIADSCSGVQDVDNRIRVQRESGLSGYSSTGSTSTSGMSTSTSASSSALGTDSTTGNGGKIRKQ
jgi:osmotically-inducible protein OsmY